jgi:transcriptional regulator with XRE-family HTH domain
MTPPLGKAAKDLRIRLNLSVRQAARELGISYVYLSRVENGHAQFSPATIERFHESWGIDLYIYTAAFFFWRDDLPKPLQKPMKALADAWRKEIVRILAKRSNQ